MEEDFQALLVKAMAEPTFYPHRVSQITRVETHISVIFLTGRYAYKIKKPVDLGFVDFRSLEQRHFFCEQEVQLNRRLTRDIYLETVAISYDGHAIKMGTGGKIVEYVVQMRQLPSTRTMAALLGEHAIKTPDLDRLAGNLVRFHRQARRVTDQPIWTFVKDACEENFRQVQPYQGRLLDAERLAGVRTATFETMDRQRALFDLRSTSGKIRDGHGDLRAEHVYFSKHGEIQILDCIEFNDHLRTVDVASDLAFLIMDLEYLQEPQFARHILEAYCRISSDASLLGLLEFYQCYRAMVRCKVNCIQLSDPGLVGDQADHLGSTARRYLELAEQYARRMTTPTIWVFCGLPGAGKSSLSSGLARQLAIASVNSDRVRKGIFGLAPIENATGPVDEGIYSAQASQRVYGRLLETARREILAGRSLVLDATYSKSAQREAVLQLAAECNAEPLFVECMASEAVLHQRLRRRESTPSVSDARPDHFETLKARFEPLTDLPPDRHIRLDTTAAMQDSLNALFIKRYLDRY